uniref:N-glycosylase/DNA lyase n=1 Tax=Arion vulgaris TaxID=1028688 RepID=A0A0B6ZDW7_9EUPU
MAACSWKHFMCTKTQLCIDIVLVAGQSFRWKKNSAGEWLGVMAGLVWRLKQTDDRILYQVYGPDKMLASKITNQNSLKTSQDGICENVDLKCVPQVCEIKQEVSDIYKSNLELGSRLRIKTENSQVEGTESISCEINELSSLNSHSRNKDRFKEEITLKQKADGLVKNVTVTVSGRRNPSRVIKIKSDQMISEDEIKTEQLQDLSNGITYSSIHEKEELHYSLLYDYFQFSIDLCDLYKYWSSKDSHFQKIGENFQGIRLIRQNPTECLLSFVCSSNNHISRISSMVEKLCTHYGERITSVDGTDYYTFPSLSALCGDDVESHLRELGFGYRAKFIASIAKDITQKKGEGWLESLQEKSYSEAKVELMTLLGVGAKVADCVCLMSLDKHEALPVDTHVWQITLKNYMARLNGAKSLTEKLYNDIGNFYRDLWGPYAGWAQAVLFAANLRHNKERNEGKTDTISIKKINDDKKLLQTEKRTRQKDSKNTITGKKKKRI